MSKNDAVVKQLLDKVEEQRKGLGTRPRGTWVTNGVFKRDSQSCFNINTINNTVTDFVRLAEALGWPLFFVATVIACIPGIGLLYLLDRDRRMREALSPEA